ncbi:MAG: SH3 domain-containing protein [Cyanobacteria bacterium P01_F01_bin.86]
MKVFLVGLTKLIFGVSLALVLHFLTGVATARYFMAKLSVLPPKPVFNNDAIVAQAESTETSPEAATEASATAASEPQSESSPESENPPGSYAAVVVQPIGLIIRGGPGLDFEQMGGVDYNEEVLVLQISEDERWLNVRIPSSGLEGWVKAGNTQKLTE